jgi:hypothetical protein
MSTGFGTGLRITADTGSGWSPAEFRALSADGVSRSSGNTGSDFSGLTGVMRKVIAGGISGPRSPESGVSGKKGGNLMTPRLSSTTF